MSATTNAGATPLGVLKTGLDWSLGVAKLATGAKSFDKNPVLSSPSLNKRFDLHVRRVRLAERMAAARRRSMAVRLSPMDRAAFEANGYILREEFLPQDLFDRVREEAMAFDGPTREMRQGPAVTRRAALDPADAGRLPYSVAAAWDPRFQALVRYVGAHDAKPFCYIQTIAAEAAATGDGADPQTNLHIDTFHPIAKAWLFLQDVGPEDGPFAYVPGSHKMTEPRAAWERAQVQGIAEHPDVYHRRGSFRVTPEDLDKMELPEPRKMTVPANTLIVADTHGVHGRSPSMKSTVRVEIYATLRRAPFAAFSGLDVFSLPGLAHKPAQRLYDALDFGEKRLGRSHAWRPVVGRRMDAGVEEISDATDADPRAMDAA